MILSRGLRGNSRTQWNSEWMENNGTGGGCEAASLSGIISEVRGLNPRRLRTRTRTGSEFRS